MDHNISASPNSSGSDALPHRRPSPGAKALHAVAPSQPHRPSSPSSPLDSDRHSRHSVRFYHITVNAMPSSPLPSFKVTNTFVSAIQSLRCQTNTGRRRRRRRRSLPPEKEDEFYSTTLVKYSQNLDPHWKTMPMAFCDVRTNTYIDCKNSLKGGEGRMRGNHKCVEYGVVCNRECGLWLAPESVICS